MANCLDPSLVVLVVVVLVLMGVVSVKIAVVASHYCY